MAIIIVRKIPNKVKKKLKRIASGQGISLKAYILDVLEKTAGEETSPDIVGIASKLFRAKNGIDLEIPPMTSTRKPIK